MYESFVGNLLKGKEMQNRGKGEGGGGEKKRTDVKGTVQSKILTSTF